MKVTLVESSKKVVEKWLKERGYTIASNENDSANGIDIVAIKENYYFTIEVKRAEKGVRCFRIKPLQKSGVISDYLAIVTPKGNVIFQTISEHKKLCSNTGYRDVTKLIRVYDL